MYYLPTISITFISNKCLFSNTNFGVSAIIESKIMCKKKGYDLFTCIKALERAE